MENNWHIEVREQFGGFDADIFVYRRGSNAGSIVVMQADGSEKEFPDYGAGIPASFRLPRQLLPSLLGALQGIGLKPPTESFVQGQLKAQSEHLADLRTLLKLDEKTV